MKVSLVTGEWRATAEERTGPENGAAHPTTSKPGAGAARQAAHELAAQPAGIRGSAGPPVPSHRAPARRRAVARPFPGRAQPATATTAVVAGMPTRLRCVGVDAERAPANQPDDGLPGAIGDYRDAAAFAAANGTAPLPASSGQVHRHRLNRGGNRQLNRALHLMALVQARCDPRARSYLAPRAGRGPELAGGAAQPQAPSLRRRVPPDAGRRSAGPLRGDLTR
jgi:Transposase IS116/IS110/IS902 family